MNFAKLVLSLCIFALATVNLPAQQAVGSDWPAVRRQATLTILIVKLKKGKTVAGYFQSAGDNELIIRNKKGSRTVARETIQKIWLGRSKPKSAKLAGLGVFLGTLLGGGFLLARLEGDSDDAGGGGILLLAGSALVAAAVVHSLTAGYKKGDLIYQTN